MTIRAAVSADRPFIERLGKATVMDSVAPTRTPDPASVLASFDRLLDIVARSSNVTLIAETHERPVGFLLLLDDLPDEVTGEAQGFIAYMAVEPEYRGTGIAAALLARAEDEARARGLSSMSLMVTEENVPARRLYEHAGYTTERRLLCKIL